MPHFPSFLIGSVASGTTFLLVHQQLSHRSRLTHQWWLAERAEDELRKGLHELKASLKNQMEIPVIDHTTTTPSGMAKDFVAKHYQQTLDGVWKFFGKQE